MVPPSVSRSAAVLAFDQQLLDGADRLSRIEAFRARAGAVHDRVAAVEPERILESIQPLAGGFVAGIRDPAVRLQQDRRPQELLAVPPVARASGGAAETENALPKAVELGALLRALQPLLVGGSRGLGL